ncbi:hypothetical protein Tco_0194249 [Tanacetum coccineum]
MFRTQTESLETEIPPTVSHELQTEAHIEQILPSPSTYQIKQRKTQKHRRAKQVTALPQTIVPLDHRADEEIGLGDRPRRPDTTLGGADAARRDECARAYASKTSCDPPLSKVNTSRRGEDSMEYHDDLTDFVPPTPHDSPLSGESLRGSKDCSRQSDHQIEIEGQEARKEEKGKNSTTYEEKTLRRQVETLTGQETRARDIPEKLVKVKRRDQGLAQIESDAELAQILHEEELAKLDRAQKERQKARKALSGLLR